MAGLFVTGTDTGVGKTVVTAALVRGLAAAGLDAAVCKPVQSGARVDDPAGDAMLLRAWTGARDRLDEICLHGFEAPLAPLVAARLAGVEVDVDELVERVRSLCQRHEALLVEGAGGLLVPVTDACTIGEIAGRLAYPVVVVARPGLGTVNHTLLTVVAARRFGLEVLGVILNGDDEQADENARMIESFGDVAVLGRTPWLAGGPSPESVAALAAHVDLEPIVRALRRERLAAR